MAASQVAGPLRFWPPTMHDLESKAGGKDDASPGAVRGGTRSPRDEFQICFFGPVGSHFGAEADEFTERMVRRELSGLTVAQLTLVASLLMELEPGMFPPIMECVRSANKVRRLYEKRANSAKAPRVSRSYYSDAQKFLGGSAPVRIRRDTEAWSWWSTYFEWRSVRYALHAMRNEASFTVPTTNPEDFDKEYAAVSETLGAGIEQ